MKHVNRIADFHCIDCPVGASLGTVNYFEPLRFQNLSAALRRDVSTRIAQGKEHGRKLPLLPWEMPLNPLKNCPPKVGFLGFVQWTYQTMPNLA